MRNEAIKRKTGSSCGGILLLILSLFRLDFISMGLMQNAFNHFTNAVPEKKETKQSQKLICTKCGDENPLFAHFCVHCGANLVEYGQKQSALTNLSSEVGEKHPNITSSEQQASNEEYPYLNIQCIDYEANRRTAESFKVENGLVRLADNFGGIVSTFMLIWGFSLPVVVAGHDLVSRFFTGKGDICLVLSVLAMYLLLYNIKFVDILTDIIEFIYYVFRFRKNNVTPASIQKLKNNGGKEDKIINILCDAHFEAWSSLYDPMLAIAVIIKFIFQIVRTYSIAVLGTQFIQDLLQIAKELIDTKDVDIAGMQLESLVRSPSLLMAGVMFVFSIFAVIICNTTIKFKKKQLCPE